ncbi:hypothetical protein ABT095_14845 [Kitasatospora sp. NPDC002227]|uniref:hypothetical protein n=1 Tax=Kitasatospora sp. NPDC002227 TaxID=3154773 RepID=UPI003323DB80
MKKLTSNRRVAAAIRCARAVREWGRVMWPGRRTVLLTVGMVFLFVLGGANAASAADGTEPGGLLAPLNVMSSEGAPLDNYDLKSENGGVTDFRSHVCNLLMGALFSLVRLLVGLMCVMIKWVYQFPIVSSLTSTADKLSSRYFLVAGNDLNLHALFLAGGFAIGLIWVMRGKFAKGFGEIALTLTLSAVVVLPAFTPKAILGPEGPLAQTQSAAREAAQMTSNVNGVEPGCTSDKDKDDPSCPIRMTLTKTLVVQPYQLLQYGVIADPNSENPRVRELADIHKRYIHGEIKGVKGDDQPGCISWLPGSEPMCQSTSSWDELKKELQKHGDEGKAAYNYSVNSNWDRVFGALLVLVATLLIAAVVLMMCLVHLGTQFADVGAATVTPVALMWGMLPGANRAVVWKWLGVFLASVTTEFAVSVMLPAFGLSTDAVLTSQEGTVMVQRMMLMVGLALVVLVFHRRLLAAAGQIGEKFARRMRYARIGGSSGLGDDSSRLGLAMSQAMSGMGVGQGGGGSGGGGGIGGVGMLGAQSPAHAALLRRAQIHSGLASLADPGLGPMNAAGMAAGALGEVRRGMAHLALPLNMAHHAVVGNPLPDHVMAKRRKPVNDGSGHLVLDHATGEILHDPSRPTPVGHLLHNKLLETRAGRLAIRGGQAVRLGYDLSAGLPATWTRARRTVANGSTAVQEQLRHYNEERAQHVADWRAGAHDMGTPVREPYNAAYHAYRTWSDVHGPEDVVASARNGVIAGLIHATTVVPGGDGLPDPDRPSVVRTVRPGEGSFDPEDLPAPAGTDLGGSPSPWEDAPASEFRAGSDADIAAALGPEAFRDGAEVAGDGTVYDPSTGEVLSAPAPLSPAAPPVPDAGDAAAEVRRRFSRTSNTADDMVWDGMDDGEPGGLDLPDLGGLL